ncbi:S-layer homology domain-containing protein [Paenibacillus hexagrammi]|uniref:S-layer homology domain-containing protein n=1 Tax=Paenibacillus hexagrammi TaxID=2908839 RepID=A0ABY3SF00_9BACL|nr:S-layer homology domain-containing protein [Paenibacillus sp. YPD9-1]UJF32568.1 S-layer homology domain-containing protein [Paenibacillus sp. YPD9-1]
MQKQMLLNCLISATLFISSCLTQISYASQQSYMPPIHSVWKSIGIEPPSDLRGHWSERVFQWAILNQIVEGYSDGTYQPDRLVTETEFLLIFYRAYGFHPLSHDNEVWSDAPYRLASYWRQPAQGLQNPTLREQPITRQNAAEIICAAQGVNFTGDEAINYLLNHHLANGKEDATVEGFSRNEPVTRAEAVQWMRTLKVNGCTSIQKRPTSPSDPDLLETISSVPYEKLSDYTSFTISTDDLTLQHKDKFFPLGTPKSVIETELGPATGTNVLLGYQYGRLGVHYDEAGNMDAWAISDDGTRSLLPFQSKKGISLNTIGILEVLKQYGTYGYYGSNDNLTANFFFEEVDGALIPRMSPAEITNPKDAFYIGFNFDPKTKKATFMYIASYLQAFP